MGGVGRGGAKKMRRRKSRNEQDRGHVGGFSLK